MSDNPFIRAFFDEATNTISYLVADPKTKRAAVIDPVLDYDPKSATVDIRSARAILAAANEGGYLVEWSLETHAHADHLLSLCESKDRRQDRDRRKHQRSSADIPSSI
jgi:glyoxylase-like metal-dependent hydrolase (beta-lactamase superfamily II)